MWSGGLGFRSVSKLVSTDFVASAAGTRTLHAQILRNSLAADEDMSAPIKSLAIIISGRPAVDVLPVGSQRLLDSVEVGHVFESLVNNQMTQYHRAKLLASAAAHSGDWLHAVPISALGLRLNDEAINQIKSTR